MHTEQIEQAFGCIDCDYTGEVEILYFDQDSKTYQRDGYRPCHCQMHHEDDESLQDK